ncbi:MAG: cytochrome c oxidase accessory protein CcoG [Cytophagales bacterium]|nr:cytochrome c oxidase accessory protein CcoG [Bernardetiaceae bacterium]MDW8211221.1 cytochrome c oxidase accessory protein CcoG [Cytophagales bacterium]
MESQIEQLIKRDESFRDRLSTIDEKGKRKWVYPKKPSGRFTRYRQAVALVLLGFFFSAPFIKVNGYPLLLINILERKFVIFGNVFWPQEMYLFVLAFLTGIVFIILFTVIYGRLFCGWVCPQTIFMEMVFRKIEYAIEGDYMQQKALDKMPWTSWEKILKKGTKYAVFYAISVLITNFFLAYIIGVEKLYQIITDPIEQHIGGFIAMLIFSGVFYTVFAYFREQVCTVVCPYGRLQGVLLDKNSIVITYDEVRGEPRGKLRKGEKRHLGDCIDCMQCVYVCPTGIDIRNGTQLECINCTACIDACDHIMDKIGKPRGLIRYASRNEIEQGRYPDAEKPKKVTPRMVAYTVVLLILLGIIGGLLFTRGMIGVRIMRAQGSLYQVSESGRISNLYNIKIINKTLHYLPLSLKVIEPANASIRIVGDSLAVAAEGLADGAFFVELDKQPLKGVKTPIKVGVYNREGKLLATAEATFTGPLQ